MQKNYFSLIMLLIICALSIFGFTCDIFNPNSSDSSDEDMDWFNGHTGEKDTTQYYVSIFGNDDNSGTSANEPFRTIKKAMKTVKPGGAIWILPGSYEEDIWLETCGNNTDSIKIVGISGRPILDGKNSLKVGIYCLDCKGLIFENLQFQNYTDIGITFESCKRSVLRNLIIKSNGHAVQLKSWELEGYGIHVEGSENILIENNDVSDNGPNPQIFPDFIMGTGINTYENENVIIRNNKSYENTGGGYLIEDSENITFVNNEAYNNDCDASADEWWDAGLWVDGGHNVLVKNNIFKGNLGCGLEISDEDDQNPAGYVLEDNLCEENYFGIYIWNFGTTDWPAENIIKSTNNQFINNTREDVWIQE